MENKPLKILGLGSPIGLDAIGWRLVEALADDPMIEKTLCQALRDPATLPAELADAHQAIIIDAASWPFGTVGRIATETLAEANGLSSHAIPVQDAIALTGVLNPGLRVHIIGIGIMAENSALEVLTAVALPQVRALVHEILGMS